MREHSNSFTHRIDWDLFLNNDAFFEAHSRWCGQWAQIAVIGGIGRDEFIQGEGRQGRVNCDTWKLEYKREYTRRLLLTRVCSDFRGTFFFLHQRRSLKIANPSKLIHFTLCALAWLTLICLKCTVLSRGVQSLQPRPRKNRLCGTNPINQSSQS